MWAYLALQDFYKFFGNGSFPRFSCFPVPSPHSKSLFSLFRLKKITNHTPPIPLFCLPISEAVKPGSFRARARFVFFPILCTALFCWIWIAFLISFWIATSAIFCPYLSVLLKGTFSCFQPSVELLLFSAFCCC